MEANESAHESENDRDARVLLRALARYGVSPHDRWRGHHGLMGPDLQRLTKLPTLRLLGAIRLLESQGHLNVRRFVGGDLTLLAVLTAVGRLEYEQASARSRA